MCILRVPDQNIKIFVVLVQSKDKIGLCLDLDIVLPIGIAIERTHAVVYQIDVNFQQMELMKVEEVKYFDSLLIIVDVAE